MLSKSQKKYLYESDYITGAERIVLCLRNMPLQYLSVDDFREWIANGTLPEAPKAEVIHAPFKCSLCGKDMVLRFRHSDGGKFWGCSGFPACRCVVSYTEVDE